MYSNDIEEKYLRRDELKARELPPFLLLNEGVDLGVLLLQSHVEAFVLQSATSVNKLLSLPYQKLHRDIPTNRPTC